MSSADIVENEGDNEQLGAHSKNTEEDVSLMKKQGTRKAVQDLVKQKSEKKKKSTLKRSAPCHSKVNLKKLTNPLPKITEETEFDNWSSDGIAPFYGFSKFNVSKSSGLKKKLKQFVKTPQFAKTKPQRSTETQQSTTKVSQTKKLIIILKRCDQDLM